MKVVIFCLNMSPKFPNPPAQRILKFFCNDSRFGENPEKIKRAKSMHCWEGIKKKKIE